MFMSETRSVIFTPTIWNDNNRHLKITHKLRAVNPYFRITAHLKIKIQDKYWFEDAYRVFDPYDDEERFLRIINNFTRVCGLEKYFYIDNNSNVWEKYPEQDKCLKIENLEIIDTDSYEVGHIMYMALGSVISACPELKEIMDIGYAEKKNKKKGG